MLDHCFRNIPQPLGSPSAATYRPIPEVARLFAEGCPYHVAIHHVSAPDGVSGSYCSFHSHPNCDEVNILIGDPGALQMDVRIGAETGRVESPATIVFPAGTPHVAQVIGGEGIIVVIHMVEHDLERPTIRVEEGPLL